MYEHILCSRAHRHGYVPKGPWLLTQQWQDLLFMHVPVPSYIIKKHIPKGLELDTYNNTAWISIIPFQVKNMHFRYLPAIPLLRSFCEINVRTYVKRQGKSGVFFFSLDANHLPTILGARIFALPYYPASIKMGNNNGRYIFSHQRNITPKAEFRVSYKPSSPFYIPKDTSLDYWLLERYFLWTNRKNTLYEGEIHHHRWKVSGAEIIVEKQDLLPHILENKRLGPPVFHYAAEKQVLFWPIHSISTFS